MDEETRRERIVPGPSGPFPQRKAGSKGSPKTSAEARLLLRGNTALDSEGIAFPAGLGTAKITGGEQEQKKTPLLSRRSGVSMDGILSPPYRPMIYLLGSTWLRRISSSSFEGVGVLTISFAFNSGKPQFSCTCSRVDPSCKDSTRMRLVVSS